jgi:mRNA-degrading endonuclease RelE of RelBE toxin-antitoxin system
LYTDQYSEQITKKLGKLKKKNPSQHREVLKKIDWILANPDHRYKELHYDMKGIQRVHLGHFVLVFRLDRVKKIISFEDYDHHDKIYLS